MSTEEEMEYQSLLSPSVDASHSSASRRPVARRRGRSSTSSHAHSLNRTSSGTTSTPKPSRRSSRCLNQSLTTHQSKKASGEVLKEVHAHLSVLPVDQAKLEFDQMNEERKGRLEQRYEFKKYYKLSTLRKIKSGILNDEPLNDEPSILIRKILHQFANEANLSLIELIDLLLHKTQRDYKAHGFVDEYINDVTSGRCAENRLIPFIQEQNDVIIIVTDQEKDVLMKLAHVNIVNRRDHNEKQASIMAYFNDSKTIHDCVNGPLRMPIVEHFRDRDINVLGRIESGSCHVGDQCLMMPNQIPVEIVKIYYQNIETDSCVSGQNVHLKLRNIQGKISRGFILCDAQQEPCVVGTVFDAEVGILDHKSIICPGCLSTICIHAIVAEVRLKNIIRLIDHSTSERIQENPKYIKQNQVAIARFELSHCEQAICMEPFSLFPRIGRFTLHDGGRTVAVGKVL